MSLILTNEIIGSYQATKGLSIKELEDLANNPTASSIQFEKPLHKSDFENLERIVFKKRPDIFLRAYGYYGIDCDLSFLKHLPSLRNFSADCLYEATGIEFICGLEKLESLSIGITTLDSFDFLTQINANIRELSLHLTNSKRIRIDAIHRFKELSYLYVEGHQTGIETISELKNIHRIVLRSISTNDLSYLRGLNKLWSIDIKIGGIKNFEALTSISNLKYLELWQVRNLSDISFISQLTTLQYLFLQSLRQVDKLPNFEKSINLRRVYLENLKGLKDLSSLQNAPALNEFIYTMAGNHEPEDLLPVLLNPKVKRVLGRFGSDKKNNRFIELANKHGKLECELNKFEYK